jgi:TPR repeat protein
MSPRLNRFLVCSLALFLFTGMPARAGVEAGKRAYEQRDYATAFKEFTPLAEKGDAAAQCFLGRMFMSGQGVAKDTDLALKWFSAAANQGNAEGQFFLGAMYLLPKKDIAQGLKWLRLSAEQGMPDAQLLLGMAYLKGGDAPRDLVEADMWLQLAEAQGDKLAPLQRERAERQMNPEQIAQVRALVARWTPKAAPKPRADANK